MASITVRSLTTGETSSDDTSWWQNAPMAPAASAGSPGGKQPRGVRNNNPLNIEAGNFTAAQPGFSGSDGRFAKFEDVDQGFAAAENLLGVYGTKHGINTVAGVINRWAPPSDGNPVSAYAASVSKDLGINPNDPLDLSNPVVRSRVASAMAKFENGVEVPRSTKAEAKPAASGDWWQAAPLAEPAKAAPAATPSAIPADPKADVGRMTALGEGARSGLFMNMGDELAGASAAGMSGLPKGVQDAAGITGKAIAAPVGVGRMIADKIMGTDGASKAYETERNRVREQSKAAQQQYPGTYIAGQIGGALALPVGGMANAATLPVRMGRGAALGAGIGGVSGAGEGENLTDRASRGTTGAVLGGVLGGVGAPVVEGLVQGGRAVAGPLVNAYRGAVNPADEAARRVTTALARDAGIDPGAAARLTPAEYAASVQSGGPARILDIGGETTRALARSAANTSPEGRGLLTRSIDEAFEGQGPRIVRWLQDTFHFPNQFAQQQALEQTQRAVNRANYGRAYIAGDRELFSEGMEQLMGSPAVVEAMRRAATTGRDRAVAEGFGAFNPGVVVENGMVNFRPGRNGVPTYPNLQFWDVVKRELDDAARVTRRSGADGEATVLEGLARNLRNELDALVPQYRAARAGAAAGFGAENALEAGANFVTSRMGNDEARALLATMTPAERQLFQDGFVSNFIQTITERGDRRNILNSIGESPAARARLNIALGPQRAAEMEAGLRVEGIIDLARNAVTGNSTTARQLAELGFAGGAGSLGVSGAYNMDPQQMTYAAVAGALLAGKRGIDTRVAQRVAEMLVSNDPQMLLRGIRLVSNNNNMMNSLRSVDRRIAAIGGEQVPSGAAVQSLGIGRAESNQPNVERPPGQ
jgi:hypothetical protein